MVVAVLGNITAQELLPILQTAFPEKNIQQSESIDVQNLTTFSSPYPSSSSTSSSSSSSLLIADVAMLKNQQSMAAREVMTIDYANKLQAAYVKHDQLLDEFHTLHVKYEELRGHLMDTLWNDCPKYMPTLASIPPMEEEGVFTETSKQVGDLLKGALLGQGQFSSVYHCSRRHEETQYALKVIEKTRFVNARTLAHISFELNHLRQLHGSPHIINVVQVHHTKSKVYVLMELGGIDLFDFMEDHDQLPEENVKEIFSEVLKGVLFCHQRGICHRNLKPENILLRYNRSSNSFRDIKLCDFGLSAQFHEDELFTEFCGSPGFFAPEMILHGRYFGDKADIWSLGCILLNLALGHARFTDCWHVAYDFERIKDKKVFGRALQEALCALLPTNLDIRALSHDFVDFILQFLQLRSCARSTLEQLRSHEWLEGLLDGCEEEEPSISDGAPPTSPLGVNTTASTETSESISALLQESDSGKNMGSSPAYIFAESGSSRKVSTCPLKREESRKFRERPALPDRHIQAKEGVAVDDSVVWAAYNNISAKERRLLEEHNIRQRERQSGGDGDDAAAAAAAVVREASEEGDGGYVGFGGNKSSDLHHSPEKKKVQDLWSAVFKVTVVDHYDHHQPKEHSKSTTPKAGDHCQHIADFQMRVLGSPRIMSLPGRAEVPQTPKAASTKRKFSEQLAAEEGDDGEEDCMTNTAINTLVNATGGNVPSVYKEGTEAIERIRQTLSPLSIIRDSNNATPAQTHLQKQFKGILGGIASTGNSQADLKVKEGFDTPPPGTPTNHLSRQPSSIPTAESKCGASAASYALLPSLPPILPISLIAGSSTADGATTTTTTTTSGEQQRHNSPSKQPLQGRISPRLLQKAGVVRSSASSTTVGLGNGSILPTEEPSPHRSRASSSSVGTSHTKPKHAKK